MNEERPRKESVKRKMSLVITPKENKRAWRKPLSIETCMSEKKAGPIDMANNNPMRIHSKSNCM